ncbi:MAG TPA: malate synthase A [Steroidobacteraceae bacterium]|nr:malate synthase A [Steroidobacteraceae bacterium]
MTKIESAASASRALPGSEIRGAMAAGFDSILTPAAIGFVTELARRFSPDVKALLARRDQRQAALDAGVLPDFLPETRGVRESDWTVAGIPADLLDRRVEITGPTERKMIINALNSGANVFMADCEDSLCPSWANLIAGQINLRDAVRRTIEFTSAEGKSYRLNDRTAVLMVRPRGWHLDEKHWLLDGAPIPGAFVDFGLYLFHNHAELAHHGTGPYFYLPKLESHLEARLWNSVFGFAEQRLGMRHGTIKCTVLIETILAAFELHEILHELRDYIVGLNCGRWDYIFSFIKKFSHDPAFVLPDRYQVTMTTHFLRSYSLLVIRTCHRRRAFAMGGMAAQIPIKNDPAANEQALAKVRADKEREAGDGHDGTWVAHPGLVPIAKQVFDRLMPGPNNLARLREDVQVSAADLLQVPAGTITEAGLRNNIAVGIQYLAAWLGGNGCVPIYNLMEDAATAEISRAQVWQWLHHRRALADGRPVTLPLVATLVREELDKLKADVGAGAYAAGHFERAAELLSELTVADRFASFLTLTAYRDID